MANTNGHFFDFYSGFLNTLMAGNGVDQRKINRKCQRVFMNVCQQLAPAVAIEVGAYEASFSCDIKRRCPDADVFAFEANPHVYEKYRDRVTAEGVQYMHLCANNSNNPIEIKIPRDFRGGERSAENQMASLLNNTKTENFELHKIDAVRVDEYIPSKVDVSKGPVIAWVDVEGALETVLNGMEKLFPHIHAMFVETETEPLWEGQWLENDAANYLMEQGFVPVAKDRQRPWQSNWIFMREELAATHWIQKRIARIYNPEL